MLWLPFLHLIMAALHSRCGHYIFALWFILSIFLLSLFSSPNLSRCRLDVYHTSTHGVALVRIGCRSETCCMRLAEKTGRKKWPKNHATSTISRLRLENAYSRPQNWGFGGDLTPKWGVMSSRPPKGTSLRENTSYDVDRQNRSTSAGSARSQE